ncbi:MAG: hypothetical protein MUF52_05380 [Syntrophobacteraceae bacterium]|nr:hypothetical protein [Syntrophobacteraceae bacterium]
MENASLQRTDYTTLLDLARASNLKVVEARGLDTRNGIRFNRNGVDWIALNADLPIHEKTRALGHLMKNSARDFAEDLGHGWRLACSKADGCVRTLCC